MNSSGGKQKGSNLTALGGGKGRRKNILFCADGVIEFELEAISIR